MGPAKATANAAPESASENAGATPRRKRGRPPKTAQGNGGNVGERAAAKGAPGKLPKNLALINRIVEIFQEYTEDEVEKIADGYRARARPTKGRPRGRSCRKPPQQ